MGKIAGLDRSGVTQKRFFQRSSPPPSVSNDPFISLNAPSLVVYQFFIQRKTQNTPILSAAPPGPARTWRKHGKGTRGETASWTREEGHGRDCHLASQPAEHLSASGNYQLAKGSWPFKKARIWGSAQQCLRLPCWFLLTSPYVTLPKDPNPNTQWPLFFQYFRLPQGLRIHHDLRSMDPEMIWPFSLSAHWGLLLSISPTEELVSGMGRSQKPHCNSVGISIFTICLEPSATLSLLLGLC